MCVRVFFKRIFSSRQNVCTGSSRSSRSVESLPSDLLGKSLIASHLVSGTHKGHRPSSAPSLSPDRFGRSCSLPWASPLPGPTGRTASGRLAQGPPRRSDLAYSSGEEDKGRAWGGGPALWSGHCAHFVSQGLTGDDGGLALSQRKWTDQPKDATERWHENALASDSAISSSEEHPRRQFRKAQRQSCQRFPAPSFLQNSKSLEATLTIKNGLDCRNCGMYTL